VSHMTMTYGRAGARRKNGSGRGLVVMIGKSRVTLI